MDKRIAGLLGAAAALTTMTAAQAAVAEPTQSAPPASYRDLLEPIPDALHALKADDARLAAERNQVNEHVAQYYHHHHHITIITTITIITATSASSRRATTITTTTTTTTTTIITTTTAALASTFASVRASDEVATNDACLANRAASVGASLSKFDCRNRMSPSHAVLEKF